MQNYIGAAGIFHFYIDMHFQLNRWPCHSAINLLSISASSEHYRAIIDTCDEDKDEDEDNSWQTEIQQSWR